MDLPSDNVLYKRKRDVSERAGIRQLLFENAGIQQRVFPAGSSAQKCTESRAVKITHKAFCIQIPESAKSFRTRSRSYKDPHV